MTKTKPEESLSVQMGELLDSVSETIDDKPEAAPAAPKVQPPPLPASEPQGLDESLAVQMGELLSELSHKVEKIEPEQSAAKSGAFGAKHTLLVLWHEDLSKARVFYGELLGLAQREQPSDAWLSYWLDGGQGSAVCVGSDTAIRERFAPPGKHVAFDLVVDDVNEAFEQLRLAGAVVVHAPTDKPWGMRCASIRDTAGYLIGLTSPIGDP
jgi:predicted enzyme related to lactoylglutathione lyase